MTDLPGYDAWKTASPDDESGCEFCEATERECRRGWQPDCCTGECGVVWRDPDHEMEAKRENDEFYRDWPAED